MAYITMMRQPTTIGADNYLYPYVGTNPTYQFYEVTLTATGTSPWILIPNDGIPVHCIMSFTGTATAQVNATDSPGSVVMGQVSGHNPITIAGIASGSATASANLAGYTAIQLDCTAYTSGNVTLSVRC